MMKYCLSLLLLLGLLVSCTNEKKSAPQLDQATAQKYMAEISSDYYEGRRPFTRGEKRTVEYLKKEIQAMGLEPVAGSYTQDVPLVEIVGHQGETMTLKTQNGEMILEKNEDFVVHTEGNQAEINMEDAEMVFCGYGIVDKSRNWNDFEGQDLKGKVAVVMINDPGFGGEDSTFFKGDEMTYSGRWTYKYEEANRQGAVGLLIIHETASAGYPWYVIKSSWTGTLLGIKKKDTDADCPIKGWISRDQAIALFENSGLDFTETIKSARKPGFKALPLNATCSVSLKSDFKEDVSQNVLGMIKGSKYPEEYIIYTAHWDHLGISTAVEGDSIYNGALDNASGVAAVMSIAKAFSEEGNRPERSIIFLFVTAEEQGLFGSLYYAENPLVPLDKTVCNLNMDGVNPIGAMKDFTIIGLGNSTMDEIAEEEAKKQGRYILPDPDPSKGYFFRSDHFCFVKVGVPALYGEGGYEHEEKGVEYAKEYKELYLEKHYHQPSDEFDPATWNFEGMMQDGQLYLNIGHRLANSREWPEWKEGSAFSR